MCKYNIVYYTMARTAKENEDFKSISFTRSNIESFLLVILVFCTI